MSLGVITRRLLRPIQSYRIFIALLLVLLPSIVNFLNIGNSAGALFAQNVSINPTGTPANSSAMLDVDATNKGVLIPRVNLTGTGDVVTITSPANSLLVYNKATAGTSPNNVVPGYYYWNGLKWIALSGQAGRSTIAFSTGVILPGSSVVSFSPVLMGFGNHTTETINPSGESTQPPEAGGFSFTIPYSGTIQNLQVSADLLVSSVSTINVIGLQYDFTVFVSPSSPNNGIDHLSSSYVTTPLTSSVRFGFPNTIIPAGTFHSATNLNTGSLAVNAGDRIGIRVRTLQATDPATSDISQLSFSASFSYVPAQ